MLEWLSDNLATFLVGLFGAGGWLGFIVNKYNKTFAELPATIKNAISHRANALQLMKEELSRRVGR